MKRRCIILLILCTLILKIEAEVKSYQFAQRDTCSLWMDVYQPVGSPSKNTCLLYVFGGGFVMGSRTDKHNVDFFESMSHRGYTVVAIDYRLGLKGVENVSPLNPKPAFEAVRIATEDLVSATHYILEHHVALSIDPKRIVLMGSSAGAITVLQADYELANRSSIVSSLPVDFRYAGVVSMAGAIFSQRGTPRYHTPPAPTLFYHGTADKIVVYSKIQLFNLGMFGSHSISKVFKKHHYPFMIVRYEGCGHEVAAFPRFYNQDQVCHFIDQAAAGSYTNELDLRIDDQHVRSHPCQMMRLTSVNSSL